MKLVNLTPHTIKIHTDTGEIITLESTGNARCETKQTEVDTVAITGTNDVVTLYRTVYGGVTGLPDSQPKTLYIVSALVRNALPERTDLASPGELLRNEAGQPVGCKGLSINV